MKFLALATLSLASMVMASPKPGCTPATYACAKNPTTGGQGWQVCDVNRKWIVSLSKSSFCFKRERILIAIVG